MRIVSILLIALLVPAYAAAADIVGTWKYADGTTTKTFYKDDTHIRMNTGPDSVMLMNGKKVYMLTKADGAWQATDMDQMGAMMKSFGGGGSALDDIEKYQADYTATGKSETIAGYLGKVYKVVVHKDSKVVSQGEVVLCNNKDVIQLNLAAAKLSARMLSSMGGSDAKAMERIYADAQKRGGMLRYGNDMTLVSLEKKNYAMAHYELPKGVQMNQMPGASPSGSGQAQSGWTPPEQQQAEEESVIEKDAKDVGQAAKDEAKDATIDEVRDGVRNVFKSLF